MGRGRGTTTDVGLREVIARGDRAGERLNILKDYFDAIEENILDKWRSTKSADKDEREELWNKYHVLSEMKRAIKLEITHGKQALQKLEDSK